MTSDPEKKITKENKIKQFMNIEIQGETTNSLVMGKKQYKQSLFFRRGQHLHFTHSEKREKR